MILRATSEERTGKSERNLQMENLFRRIISFGIAFILLLSMTISAIAASNNTYVEGNTERIVVSFDQVSGSTYKVTIRNNRENAIGEWALSFKTNFNLSDPEGADWSVSNNNTYTFTDPENGTIVSGDSFSFTVQSSKKKNSEIHNVDFKYKDAAEQDDREACIKDTDDDGLPDWIENILETDISKADTDGDGMTDYDEYVTVLTDPLKRDSIGKGHSDAEYDFDSDGLTNSEEVSIGSNPYKEDTDNDDLADSDECRYGTNPSKNDTDGDGMTDGAEIKYGMEPTNPDTLGDSIFDGNRIFDAVIDNKDALEEYGITTAVNVRLKGNQVHSLSVEKIDISDPFLSDQIPGFIGNAFEYTVDGEFDLAKISFEFQERLLTDSTFDPVIYYFNEEEQLLEEVENQSVNGNVVSADVTHFSKYILLNRTAYADVWKYEIKYDTSAKSFKNIDVAFVIDSSGSMFTNDQADIRKEVTKKFIDKLSTDDRGAVIDFDYFATIYSEFSYDKTALSAAVDKIDSLGGTNLTSGIQSALNLFLSTTYVNNDSLKVIIMLTDGDGAYDTKLTETAKNNDIIIYTVGLGDSVNVSRLTDMAEGTTGNYYPASDAEKLYGIFEDIADEADMQKDTDSDGISDYFEKEMNAGRLRLGTGVPIIGIDYLNADSDGDALTDGKEMSVVKTGKQPGSEKIYVKLYSNPTLRDTDGDGLMDPEDERPLYAFRYNYLGSTEHLKYVEERINLKMPINDKHDIDKTITEWIYGCEILMSDYYDFLTYKGVDPTDKIKEEYWDESWDKYWDVYCEKFNEYVTMHVSVNEDLHYFRNNLNVIYDWEMVTNSSDWAEMDEKLSALHQHNQNPAGTQNSKWISDNGFYELVFNGYNELQNAENNPEDMGTYNYANPSDDIGHLRYDVIPWIFFGNTITDTTTMAERSRDSVKGLIEM